MKTTIIKGLYYTSLATLAISSCIQCMGEYKKYREAKFETAFMKFKLYYPDGGVLIHDYSTVVVFFSINDREKYRVFQSFDDWKNWTIALFHDV